MPRDESCLLRVATRPVSSFAPFRVQNGAEAACGLASIERRLASEAEDLERALHELAGPKAEKGGAGAARAGSEDRLTIRAG